MLLLTSLNVSKSDKDQVTSVILRKLKKDIEKLRAVGVKAWSMQETLAT